MLILNLIMITQNLLLEWKIHKYWRRHYKHVIINLNPAYFNSYSLNPASFNSFTLNPAPLISPSLNPASLKVFGLNA